VEQWVNSKRDHVSCGQFWKRTKPNSLLVAVRDTGVDLILLIPVNSSMPSLQLSPMEWAWDWRSAFYYRSARGTAMGHSKLTAGAPFSSSLCRQTTRVCHERSRASGIPSLMTMNHPGSPKRSSGVCRSARGNIRFGARCFCKVATPMYPVAWYLT